MYAYIKLLSGKNKDKKKIIPTSCIKNFKPESHKKILKYQVEETVGEEPYVATILLLSDSNEELKEIIRTKSVRASPSYLLVTASDKSDNEGKKQLKRSKTFQMNRQLKEQEELVCNKLSKFKSDLLPINVTLKDKENLDLSNITDTPPSPKKYRVTEDLAQTKINSCKMTI
ncbi:uncharacterized protein LOC118648270 [Monomorium pharaonis]|uniref:uncharacterized protein LOC118648154 n=1 Tax=Monomorium pharaonis TaxID=307658 RepID=UPI0017465F81|nr:uncharacterized protein LOC118648154 [Monomorium pharaonis]XP_036150348.1 uncharacterized protein LOC118648154 [Monomorium pharaonis]XP_036150486.1 uncharacterized protein LOC118648270 [Monomorium pharaonis]